MHPGTCNLSHWWEEKRGTSLDVLMAPWIHLPGQDYLQSLIFGSIPTRDIVGSEKLFQDAEKKHWPRQLHNSSYTCDVEWYHLTALGHLAIVGLAVVVSRIFCSQREVEGHSSSKGSWAVPQGTIFMIKLVQDRRRASLGFTVKFHYVPHHQLGCRSPEGEDRARHWNWEIVDCHRRSLMMTLPSPAHRGSIPVNFLRVPQRNTLAELKGSGTYFWQWWSPAHWRWAQSHCQLHSNTGQSHSLSLQGSQMLPSVNAGSSLSDLNPGLLWTRRRWYLLCPQWPNTQEPASLPPSGVHLEVVSPNSRYRWGLLHEYKMTQEGPE